MPSSPMELPWQGEPRSEPRSNDCLEIVLRRYARSALARADLLSLIISDRFFSSPYIDHTINHHLLRTILRT